MLKNKHWNLGEKMQKYRMPNEILYMLTSAEIVYVFQWMVLPWWKR